jgi:hypothetical protein
MKIRTVLIAAIAAIFAVAVGCSDDPSTTTTSSGTSSSSTSSSSGSLGKMPTLGGQIDRMGRPAINTAANKTFEKDATKADMGKDAWNANSDPSKWKTDYVAEIQTNIAILDSLDTVCGNQLLADTTKMDPTRYAGLAGVLADDRLYVNAAGASCTTYLAVEANFLGTANTDCGGRTLAYDVIDASYTVLATGALDGSVGDAVPISDAAKGESFPYLAAPY